jgi:hypothetical protein
MYSHLQVGFEVLTAVSTIIALMMEAARTSETLVNFYQTTRRYNPEDSHLSHLQVQYNACIVIKVKKNIPRSTSWPIICDLCFLQR